jgi:hypothetical protein
MAEVVGDGQAFESSAAAGQGIADEVHARDRVGPVRR